MLPYTNGGDEIVQTIAAASASREDDTRLQSSVSASRIDSATTTSKKGIAGSVVVQRGFMVTISALAMAVGFVSC